MNQESKEQKTDVVKSTKAGMLQMNAARFNCTIIEIGIAGEGNARISIEGTPEDLKALFEYVDNAIAE